VTAGVLTAADLLRIRGAIRIERIVQQTNAAVELAAACEAMFLPWAVEQVAFLSSISGGVERARQWVATMDALLLRLLRYLDESTVPVVVECPDPPRGVLRIEIGSAFSPADGPVLKAKDQVHRMRAAIAAACEAPSSGREVVS
jgi:hypothetical protein